MKKLLFIYTLIIVTASISSVASAEWRFLGNVYDKMDLYIDDKETKCTEGVCEFYVRQDWLFKSEDRLLYLQFKIDCKGKKATVTYMKAYKYSSKEFLEERNLNKVIPITPGSVAEMLYQEKCK